MQVNVQTRAAAGARVDLLAVPLVELDARRWRLPARAAALDRASGGRITAVIESGDFRGKRGESALIHAPEGLAARRLLLVGLGKESDLDTDGLREAAGIAVGAASARGAEKLAVTGITTRRLRAAAAAQALAEGAVLASYRFDRYRKRAEDAKPPAASAALLFEGASASDARAARAAASTGVILAESQNVARDLSNEPPNELPPAVLAREAERVAKETGLRCRVLEVAELRRRKMGAILAVGGGSSRPPRLIVLEHNAPGGRGRKKKGRSGKAPRRRPTVCLVGKGITFDTGGISLKPTTSMVKMKHDMSGGAAVIGALRAAALLKLPLHVVGIVSAAENMPSGTAYRPDDIVATASGRTVEVANTDAEGRMVLADALHFAQEEFEPAAMVDVATLTGACAVALGTWAAAVLGNDERLVEALRRAGDTTGERFWQLPLWDVHREHMRSQIADVKQTGGRDGGTITAAAFLWHFVSDDTPWAHLDIASTADTERKGPLQPRAGATGFGVRTLVELLRSWRHTKL